MASGVVLGINHEDMIPASFAVCVQRVASYGVGAIWCRGYAGRLDIGRNKVMQAFLDDYDEDWLLMVDTDTVFQDADVANLLKSAHHGHHPIIGGLYVNELSEPMAYRWVDDRVKRWDGKGGGIVKVDLLGFGFTAISRNVIEDMSKGRHVAGDTPPCDNARTGPADQPLSDDFSFMYLASQLGYKAYLNTNVKVGHWKGGVIYP